MITLMQKAVGYFVRGPDENSAKLDELNRPRLEDFILVSCSEREIHNFEGVITFVNMSVIVINNDIYCDSSLFPTGRKVNINDKVRGVAERCSNRDAWRAVKVLFLQEDEWDAADKDAAVGKQTSSGNKLLARSGESGAIPCRDLEAGIPGFLRQDLFSQMDKTDHTDWLGEPVNNFPDIQPTIMGRVVAIYGDTISLNEGITFCLSPADYDFKVIEGEKDVLIGLFGTR